MKHLLLIALAALLLVACKPDSASEPAAEELIQEPVATTGANIQAVSESSKGNPPPDGYSRAALSGLYAKAIGHPERPQTDADRDLQRQPAAALELLSTLR